MEEMIKHIIDTDKKAREIIESAQNELVESEKTIIENSKKLRDEVLSQARNRNIKNKEIEKYVLEQEWEKKKADYENQIKRLDELAKKRSDEWVDALVSRILDH